jgi:hypothetical protein
MIQNIRDFLVVVIAPELGKFMLDQQLRYNYPKPLTTEQVAAMMQEIVGFTLDSMTSLSLERLLEYRREIEEAAAENKAADK